MGNQRASAVLGRDEKLELGSAANLRPEVALLLAQVEDGCVIESYTPQRVFASDNLGLRYGAGSPVALAKGVYFQAGSSELYISPVAAPAGASAATAQILPQGSTASKSFTAVYYINGLEIPFTVSKGMSVYEALEALQTAAEKQASLPVKMQGGVAEAGYFVTGDIGTLAAFQALTDGEFALGPYEFSGLDFSGISAKSGIADVLNADSDFAALFTASYENGKLKITAKMPATLVDYINPVSSGSGTDISGTGFLNGASGVAQIVDAVTADNLSLTAKWSGQTGNELQHSISALRGAKLSEAEHGIGLLCSEFAGGAGVPDLAANLAAIPESLKITRIINQFGDELSLNAVADFCASRDNERLTEMLRSYYRFWFGADDLTLARDALLGLAEKRIDDAYNCCLPLPSRELGVQVAAEVVAKLADNFGAEPGRPFRGVKLEQVTPLNEAYFSYAVRDALLKAGISNFELRGKSYYAMDLLCHYHPVGDTIEDAEPAIKSFEEDHTAMANMKHDLRLVFQESEAYRNAKFVAEGVVSRKQFVKTLADVAQSRNQRLDLWQDLGLVFSSDWAKEQSPLPFFDGQNQERVMIPVKVKHAITGRIYDFTVAVTKAAV